MPRKVKSTWLKGCEVCNVGLIKEIDRLVEDGNIKVAKAAALVAKEGERKLGEKLYTAKALMNRYRNHKGLDKPKVSQNGKQDKPQTSTSKEKAKTAGTEKCTEPKEQAANEPKKKPQEDASEGKELPMGPPTAEGAEEIGKASAQANKPKPSELEKAAKLITSACDKLQDIVDGNIKDNGSRLDMLAAETIKRCGPRWIHNYSRIGIDPESVARFHEGEKDGKSIGQSNTRLVEGNQTDTQEIEQDQ